jgi:hypothetical protein
MQPQLFSALDRVNGDAVYFDREDRKRSLISLCLQPISIRGKSFSALHQVLSFRRRVRQRLLPDPGKCGQFSFLPL